nr:fatty-acid amide hydrolase 2-B-like [Leptinotarsa decemlineata]
MEADSSSSTFRQVPSTILSSSESDEKMPPGIIAVRILFWMAMKSVNLLYIPVLATRLFKKSKKCPPIQDQILLLSAAELADRIRNRQISCETVIKAYISRIQEVNPIINAIIEDRFQEALEDAKKVDALLAGPSVNLEELKEKCPLLGVPITIKGSIEVKNMKSTSGMVKRADIIAKEDAVTVKYAREAGAIILLTSNIPELCLNWESTNKLIGTTKNPYNTTRTCGGSSGGEVGYKIALFCFLVNGIGPDRFLIERFAEKYLPLLRYAPELSSIVLLDIDDVDNLFTGKGDGSVMELLRYMTFRSNSVITSILYGLLRKLSKHVPRSTTEYCTRKLDELKSDFIKLLGKDGVLLIPSFTAEAHHHGEIFRKALDSAYLSIFNALGLPVTNCPVRFTKGGLPVGIQVRNNECFEGASDELFSVQ